MGNSNSINETDTMSRLVDSLLLDYKWNEQTLTNFYNKTGDINKSSIPLDEIKKGLESILKIQHYMLQYYTNINLNEKKIKRITSRIGVLESRIKDLDLNFNETQRAKEALFLYFNYCLTMYINKTKLEKQYINTLSNVNFNF